MFKNLFLNFTGMACLESFRYENRQWIAHLKVIRNLKNVNSRENVLLICKVTDKKIIDAFMNLNHYLPNNQVILHYLAEYADFEVGTARFEDSHVDELESYHVLKLKCILTGIHDYFISGESHIMHQSNLIR